MTTVEQAVRKVEMAALAEKLTAENEIVIMFTKQKDGQSAEVTIQGTGGQLIGALGLVCAAILEEFPKKYRKALTAKMVECLIAASGMVDEREG